MVCNILRVVICFIILTDLTEFSVEVFCGWSVRWLRRSQCEKKEERQELKLGDARGTPSKYSRRLKRLSLGMLGRHPLFLQQISVCFRIRFVHAICASLGASFAFRFLFFFLCTMLVWDSPWLIYRMLISLHLIFWVWLYRMLHVLHLYHLKFGLPVSLRIGSHHL